MKSLKKLFASENFIFLLFSIIILTASMITTPYRALTAHQDTIYTGAEFYPEDYSIYVSNILQGQKGRWTLLDKHTSEPHQGTIIHGEYLLWGKLTGVLGFDPITSFHLSRVFFGAILLFAIFCFLKIILPQKIRTLALFLIIFSAGFPIITTSPQGSFIIRTHMDWLTEIDVLLRFTALPHYLMGNLFFILALTFFLKLSFRSNLDHLDNLLAPRSPAKQDEVGGNLKNLTVFLISGVLMSLIHPVNLVIFYSTLAVYLLFSTIIRLLISNSKFLVLSSQFKKEVIPVLLFFITTAPVLLYYKSQFSVPPWNHMAAWEGITQYILPLKEYVLAIGPIFFLAPLGLLALLFSKTSLLRLPALTTRPTTHNSPSPQIQNSLLLGLLFLSWILSFFILIFYSYPFLTISQVRFMQNFIFIPFGILGAVGIVWLANLLKSLLHLSVSLNTLFLILITLTIVPSLPTYYRSMEIKLTIFKPDDILIFPKKNWVEAIRWLGQNSNPNEVVISAYHAGHAIPYLGGNTVYVGHIWATLDRKNKEEKLYQFLKGEMTEEKAKAFLNEARASYLFFGYQEKIYGLQPEKMAFLNKIFDNTQVQIYKIIL